VSKFTGAPLGANSYLNNFALRFGVHRLSGVDWQETRVPDFSLEEGSVSYRTCDRSPKIERKHSEVCFRQFVFRAVYPKRRTQKKPREKLSVSGHGGGDHNLRGGVLLFNELDRWAPSWALEASA